MGDSSIRLYPVPHWRIGVYTNGIFTVFEKMFFVTYLPENQLFLPATGPFGPA
jgi:hypothetical protein